jgi:hypothetical protein
LDRLGLNPDLKTAWDVLPLSFAVDYLIPVGDILESLHPRGWVRNSVEFSGEYSFNAQIRKGYYLYPRDSPAFFKNVENWSYNTVYHREPVPSVFKPPQLPEWQAPNLREIFNLGYLTTALKNFNVSSAYKGLKNLS